MENKTSIKLADGKEIVVELYNYDGDHPEIVVFIEENGAVVQDICMVRPREDTMDVECIVWSNEYSEDYTHKFIIHQYKEEE